VARKKGGKERGERQERGTRREKRRRRKEEEKRRKERKKEGRLDSLTIKPRLPACTEYTMKLMKLSLSWKPRERRERRR
jgi:hypothetical protein